MNVVAKLFMDGGDQAVDLPEEFRFEGTEVRISKVGDTVILEPLRPLTRPDAETAAIRAEIDTLQDGEEVLPDGGLDDPPPAS